MDIEPYRILSPKNKFIKYNGKQHKYYIKKGIMIVPSNLMLYYQQGYRLAIYKKR
jgi:hypothetical protein